MTTHKSNLHTFYSRLAPNTKAGLLVNIILSFTITISASLIQSQSVSVRGLNSTSGANEDCLPG